MTNAELINSLRDVPCWAIGTETEETMLAAADAIERLQADITKKDSQLAEWKQAWKTAYKCYQSAQAEIDEMRGAEPDAEGDDSNEASEPNP